MQNIQSIPGKLFYIVYILYKQNAIDIHGKQILKGKKFIKFLDLIIQNNSQIVKTYENY